jgi:Spy/CpxP family protein refolding chaperone
VGAAAAVGGAAAVGAAAAVGDAAAVGAAAAVGGCDHRGVDSGPCWKRGFPASLKLVTHYVLVFAGHAIT